MSLGERLGSVWAAIRAFVREKFSYIVVAGASAFVGVALVMVYGSVVDYTHSLQFCAHTCHEMEATVYQEYTKSKHFKNPQGVVVVCADCHVPHHDWAGVFVKKFFATFELWGHFVRGEYDLDKFNPRRPILAKRVWAEFKENNARECKACHRYKNMVLADQRTSVRAQHIDAMKIDQNCLDCHKGVTHKNFEPKPKPDDSGGFDIE